MNHQGVTQKPMNSIKIIQTQQPNISYNIYSFNSFYFITI